ncbi:cation channel protein [Acrasis kona]|uniref:Cation channel protein n=1 Tax=Acrasis kona TaxID=1008807 RepID=A0AAW2ZC84_9EUKA
MNLSRTISMDDSPRFPIPSTIRNEITIADDVSFRNHHSLAALEAEELNYSATDKFRHTLSRIVYSKVYWLFFFVIIALNIALLIYNVVKLLDHPKEWWYITLEFIINGFLVLDVVVRIIVEGQTYFRKWLNWLDLILTASCVISLIVYLISVQGSFEEGVGEVFDIVLVILRFATQVPRIILFIRNQWKRRDVFKKQYIDLGESAEVNLDPLPQKNHDDKSDDEVELRLSA